MTSGIFLDMTLLLSENYESLLVDTLEVKRDNILEPDMTCRRRHLGNLQRLGQSLDKFQTTPMIATRDFYTERYRIHDGIRRLISADRGYAPKFAKRNCYQLLVLSKKDGKIPTKSEALRYCAVSKLSRNNWTYIDEALYYNEEIRAAFQNTTNISKQQQRILRAKIINELALADGVTTKTIRNRLSVLELPLIVQDQLARGNLKADSAQRLRNFTEIEALQILLRAAKIEGVELARCWMPGDVHAFNVLNDTDKLIINTECSRSIRTCNIERAIEEAWTANEVFSRGEVRSEKEIRRAISELNDRIDKTPELCNVLKTLQWTIYENPSLPTLQ